MAYLTGPTRTLADFQVEYAGLLLGPGTPYDLPPTWTFLDSPPVKSMDTAKPWADGSWSGPDFADVIAWQIPVELAPDAGVSFADALSAYERTIAIAKASRPLWVKLPGRPVRGIPARVNQRSLPIDLGFGQLIAGAVQWRAPNPIWQSLPRTVTLTPATSPAGLDFPLFDPAGADIAVLDFGAGGAASYAQVISNAGNTDAPPAAVATGPTAGFQVTINGRIVAYSDTLLAGDTVSLDWATGRAYLSVSGSAPVDRTYLLTARDFSGVIPAGGSATVTFAGTGGTCAVTTADLWR